MKCLGKKPQNYGMYGRVSDQKDCDEDVLIAQY
jgi:hypothetical protein